MRTKTPPDIPDLDLPTVAPSEPPASFASELDDAIERSPSFLPPDSTRIAGEWAEYSEPTAGASGSVPPPRTSGFVLARRPTPDVRADGFPFLTPLPRQRRVRGSSWLVALGPGVLLVAASVVMTFFDQRSVVFGAAPVAEFDLRPPTWIAAFTCCLGLVSIALGARRFVRSRYY